MNAKAALCVALLRGDVVSIKSGFNDFGITNIPREIGRSIEREADGGFGVVVSRIKKEGRSRWGQKCIWYEYRLNRTAMNMPGIEKMKEYIRQHTKDELNPKTKEDLKKWHQIQMALQY